MNDDEIDRAMRFVDHLQLQTRRACHRDMLARGVDLDAMDDALREFDVEHAGYRAAVLAFLREQVAPRAGCLIGEPASPTRH